MRYYTLDAFRDVPGRNWDADGHGTAPWSERVAEMTRHGLTEDEGRAAAREILARHPDVRRVRLLEEPYDPARPFIWILA